VNGVEAITVGETVLAYVISANETERATHFFTDDSAIFQAGFVVYPAGGRVLPHAHLPLERRIVGTSEMLLVRNGRCIVDIYDDERRLVASRELVTGDAVLSLAGGHGFRMLEDTVLFELKQGPYEGVAEKERFEPGGQGSTA
jgi:hypothetical protein